MWQALQGLVRDPAVRWLAFARLVQFGAAPVTLWLALARLTDEGRAIYAIAVNIAVLGTAFELGPGTLVVQLAAHAAADARAALRRAARRWYGLAAFAVILLLAPAGLWLHRTRAPHLAEPFDLLWLALVVLVAAYLPLVPAIALREGGGDAVPVQRLRAAQAATVAAVSIIGLAAGLPLLASVLAAGALLALAAAFVSVGPEEVPGTSLAAADRFRREQPRTALVWLAIWAAPQCVTPVVLAVRDAREAGPVGIGMALALAPLVIAIAWLHGRYAAFGALVAQGRVAALDRATGEATRHALVVFVALAAAVLALPALLDRVRPDLAPRILPPIGLALLLLGHAALLLVQAMLAWARAFAEEALAGPGTVACAMMAMGAVLGAWQGGALGAAAGYALGGVTGLLGVVARFTALRRAKAPRG